MIVGVLTTFHTQYTWDRSICIFLFNRTTCSSSSRKYPETKGTNQNRHWNHHPWHATNSLERTRLSCWCLENHKGCTYRAPVRYVTRTWSVVLLNKKIHILLSQVYCVWQVVKTPTIISNNPVFYVHYINMEINEAVAAKYTMYGQLCVLLRSVLLRFMTADVLQESNFTIRASPRRGKFVAVDMSLVSSNAVQIFFSHFHCSLHSIFTTETRCPPIPHYTITRTLNSTTELSPWQMTATWFQPQDYLANEYHNTV